MSFKLPDSSSLKKGGSCSSSGAYRKPVSVTKYSSAGFAVALAVGTGVALGATSVAGTSVQHARSKPRVTSHDRRRPRDIGGGWQAGPSGINRTIVRCLHGDSAHSSQGDAALVLYAHRHGRVPALVLGAALRSEEHTSELQSRFDLVCRLLLEKKKRKR